MLLYESLSTLSTTTAVKATQLGSLGIVCSSSSGNTESQAEREKEAGGCVREPARGGYPFFCFELYKANPIFLLSHFTFVAALARHLKALI